MARGISPRGMPCQTGNHNLVRFGVPIDEYVIAPLESVWIQHKNTVEDPSHLLPGALVDILVSVST
jgi:hypothetical protein